MTNKELSQLYNLNRECERLEEEIERLESEAESTTQRFKTVPISGNRTSDKVARIAVELATKRAMIPILHRQIDDERVRLIRWIECIDDSLVRMIAFGRYVDGLPWEQVAAGINADMSGEVARVTMYRYIRDH